MHGKKLLLFALLSGMFLSACTQTPGNETNNSQDTNQTQGDNNSQKTEEEESGKQEEDLVKSITISKDKITLYNHDAIPLSVKTENLYGDVTWTSADESVATVDSVGVVQYVGPGETTITASVGDYSASCLVTAIDISEAEFTITFKCKYTVEKEFVIDCKGEVVLDSEMIPRFTPLQGAIINDYEYYRLCGEVVFRTTTYEIKANLENYNLSFELDGGEFNGSKYDYNRFNLDDVLAEKEIPVSTKMGYNFGGYYLEPAFIHLVENFGDIPCQHTTLYAKFTIVSTHIKIYETKDAFEKDEEPYMEFDIQTGEYWPEVLCPRYGYSIESIKICEDDRPFTDVSGGYIEGGSKTYFPMKDKDSNYVESLNLYLYMTTPTYFIRYQNYPDEYETFIYTDAIRTYTVDTKGDLPVPYAPGLVFEGYYLDEQFTQEFTTLNQGRDGILETFDLYVKWSYNSVNVTYKFDDSSLNKTVQARSLEYTYLEYDLDGYDVIFYSDKEKTDDIKRVYPYDEDITIYCKLVPIVYDISYEFNEGVVDKDVPISYTIEDEIILPEPTKEFHKFDGWYLDSSFEEKVTKIEKGTFGDLTLYAKWSEIGKTINYHLYGGTNNADNPEEWCLSSDFALLDPTKKGCSFDKWYLDEEFTKPLTKISVEALGKFEEIDVYAKFKARHSIDSSEAKYYTFNDDNYTFDLVVTNSSYAIVESVSHPVTGMAYSLGSVTVDRVNGPFDIKIPDIDVEFKGSINNNPNNYYLPESCYFDESALKAPGNYYISGHDELDVISLLNEDGTNLIFKNFKYVSRSDPAGIVCEKDGVEYLIATNYSSYFDSPVTLSEEHSYVDGLQVKGIASVARNYSPYLIMDDSIEIVYPNAFSVCERQLQITFSKNIKTLPTNLGIKLGENCEIVLPEGLERIEKDAFKGYTGKISLPSSLKFIGEGGLGNALVDTEINLTEGLSGLKDDVWAFYGFEGSVTVDDVKYNLYDQGGEKEAVVIFYEGEKDYLDIPSMINGHKVKAIGRDAFKNNTQLKFIRFPSTVDTVFPGAFKNANLEHLFFSDIKYIGKDAFFTSRIRLMVCDSIEPTEQNELEFTHSYITTLIVKNVPFPNGYRFDGIYCDFNYGNIPVLYEDESGLFYFDRNTKTFHLACAKDNGTNEYLFSPDDFVKNWLGAPGNFFPDGYKFIIDSYAFEPIFTNTLRSITFTTRNSGLIKTCEDNAIYGIGVESIDVPGNLNTFSCCYNLKEYRVGNYLLKDGIYVVKSSDKYHTMIDGHIAVDEGTFANFYVDGDFVFGKNANGKYILLDYVGDSKTTLNLPSTYKGNRVDYIGGTAVNSINEKIQILGVPNIYEMLQGEFTIKTINRTLEERDGVVFYHGYGYDRYIYTFANQQEITLKENENEFFEYSDEFFVGDVDQIISLNLQFYVSYPYRIVDYTKFTNLKYILADYYSFDENSFKGMDGITFYLPLWLKKEYGKDDSYFTFLESVTNYTLVFYDEANPPATLIPE